MFFFRNLKLFIAIVSLFLLFSVFYFIINKPSVNYTKINSYKNELKKKEIEKMAIERTYYENKRKFNYLKQLIFSPEEKTDIIKIINSLNDLNKDIYHCTFYGITNDNLYINVINVYYQCNTKKDALLMSKITGYFLNRLGIPYKDIQVNSPSYVKINLYKKPETITARNKNVKIK